MRANKKGKWDNLQSGLGETCELDEANTVSKTCSSTSDDCLSDSGESEQERNHLIVREQRAQKGSESVAAVNMLKSFLRVTWMLL